MNDAKNRMEEIRSYPSTFLLWEYDRLIQRLDLLLDLEDSVLEPMMQDIEYIRGEILYRLDQGEGGAV